MPFKKKYDKMEWNRERQRKLREDPDFLAKESERKARWYQENKAKKRQAQRDYRERIKRQRMLEQSKEVEGE